VVSVVIAIPIVVAIAVAVVVTLGVVLVAFRCRALLAGVEILARRAAEQALLAVLDFFVRLALEASVTLGLRLGLPALDVRQRLCRCDRGPREHRTNRESETDHFVPPLHARNALFSSAQAL
jgi:hypothetical protein